MEVILLFLPLFRNSMSWFPRILIKRWLRLWNGANLCWINLGVKKIRMLRMEMKIIIILDSNNYELILKAWQRSLEPSASRFLQPGNQRRKKKNGINIQWENQLYSKHSHWVAQGGRSTPQKSSIKRSWKTWYSIRMQCSSINEWKQDLGVAQPQKWEQTTQRLEPQY